MPHDEDVRFFLKMANNRRNLTRKLDGKLDEKLDGLRFPQKTGAPKFGALEVFDPEQPFCGHRGTSSAAEVG
ncbi:MAG: hypothetical protein ABSC05_26410 [Candidatus Solibacter sp.]